MKFLVFIEQRDGKVRKASLEALSTARKLSGGSAAAVIAGRFTGRLVIEGKLEIGASVVIHADIVAHAVAIARGAVVDGEVTVTGGQPVVHFDEKRHHPHGRAER